MENQPQPNQQPERPIEAIVDDLFSESDVIIHAMLARVLQRIKDE